MITDYSRSKENCVSICLGIISTDAYQIISIKWTFYIVLLTLSRPPARCQEQHVNTLAILHIYHIKNLIHVYYENYHVNWVKMICELVAGCVTRTVWSNNVQSLSHARNDKIYLLPSNFACGQTSLLLLLQWTLSKRTPLGP